MICFKNGKPYWKWQDNTKNVNKRPVKFYLVMTIINLALICLLAVVLFQERVSYQKEEELNAIPPNFAKFDSLELIAVNDKTTFTAYTLSFNETDENPCVGAGNNNLCELRPILREKGQRICASRDLPLNSVVYIEGFGECVILDRMNKRYEGTGRIDILMDTKEEALNFGIRQLNYIKLY